MRNTLFIMLFTTISLFAGQSLSSEIKASKIECKKGNVMSCKLLGEYYQTIAEKEPNNYIEAFNIYLIGCNHKDATSCFNVGVSYNVGLGVRQSSEVAQEFFGKACDGGMQDGCKAYSIMNKKAQND